MRKRKLGNLLLAAALVCSLAGCGSANSSSQTAQAEESTAGSTAETQREETGGEESGNIGTQEENSGRRLILTLEGEEGTREISAVLNDTPAAEEFVSLLPVTVEMHEHLNRQKEVYLPFSLSEEHLTNQVHEYEIGDIVYWHPGPTMGIFHDHDGRSISAGVEVLAWLDQEGIDALGSYENDVEVTVTLTE